MITGSAERFRAQFRFTGISSIINAIPFAALVLSLFYWIPVIWLKYFTLHDYVFDSGVFYGSLHSIFFQHTQQLLLQYAAGSTIRIILSPLSTFNSILLLLYLQLILVLGSSITVFLIARKMFSGRVAPVLLSLSYLLYFPVNGSIFFDVHAQTFFLPLMLVAYYLEISGKYRASLVFFVLAGITRFPIIGIIVLYSMADFIYSYRTLRNPESREIRNKRARFAMILFSVSFIITLLQYYENTYVLGVSSLGNIHYVAGSTVLGGSLGTDLITVLIFAAPLLLLPLYYSEFSIILWALFGFAFYTNYYGYLYPSVFTDQYSALFVPLIFISLFAGIAARSSTGKIYSENKTGRFNIGKPSPQMATAIKIFVAVAVFAVLFQPYSPLSSHTSGSMDIANYTTIGMLNEREMQSVINLIPTDASGIIFPGNMPEVMIHSANVNGSLIADTINGYPLYWSPQFFQYNNSIQYVIGDTTDLSTTPVPNAYNQYEITRNAISSGQFGVMAEYHGAYLLGRNYFGKPVLFSPIAYPKVGYSRMVALNSSYSIDNGLLLQNASSASILPAESTILYPGSYVAYLNLSEVKITGHGTFELRLSAFDVPGNTVLDVANLMDGQSTIMMNFTLDNFYSNANIFITNLTFTGTVAVNSIYMEETAA